MLFFPHVRWHVLDRPSALRPCWVQPCNNTLLLIAKKWLSRERPKGVECNKSSKNCSKVKKLWLVQQICTSKKHEDTQECFSKIFLSPKGLNHYEHKQLEKVVDFKVFFFLVMFTQNHKNKRRNLLQLFASRCGSVDCGKNSFGSQTFALVFCHENKNIVVRYRPFGGSSTNESKRALDLATKSLVVDYNGAWQMTIFCNPLLSQAFLSLTHHSVLL